MKNWLKQQAENYFGRWATPSVNGAIDGKLEQPYEIRMQLDEFEKSSDTERASYWEAKFDAREFTERFDKAGIAVEQIEINIKDFERWMSENSALIADYGNMADVRIEKILEHYLTLKYLDVKLDDIFIDVAAADSPFADLLRKKGMTAYSQDLVYPVGLRGCKIGSDAGRMPVNDRFADVLTLHCAYECFQGDGDIRFAREASRILKKGGRLGIAPLYIDTIHFVKTSPWSDKRKIDVEREARVLWRDDQYKEPFSRHYSPESFVERIACQMPEMEKKILCFKNLDTLSEHFKGQRIYCHFMFKGVMA